MKRPPAYQLHKATGQACVKIAGKFHYLGKHGTKESKNRYADLIAGREPEPRSSHAASSLTVAEMVFAFTPRNDAEYSAESPEPEQFRYAINDLLAVCGSIPVADFQAMHLAELQKHMAKRLSRGVVNRRMARVKLAFRRAELWGIIPPGIFSKLAVVTGSMTKAKKAANIEPADFASVMAVVRRLRDRRKNEVVAQQRILYSMLLLQWWTGMRPGEVRMMRWQDIDRSKPVWVYRPGSDEPHGRHKNAWRGQDRFIYLGPKCQSVLKAFEGLKGYLFTTTRKRCYSTVAYGNRIRAAADSIDITLSPQWVRHGCKRRIETLHGEPAAKAILGQESLDSTRKYARAHDAKLATDIARKTA